MASDGFAAATPMTSPFDRCPLHTDVTPLGCFTELSFKFATVTAAQMPSFFRFFPPLSQVNGQALPLLLNRQSLGTEDMSDAVSFRFDEKVSIVRPRMPS